MTSRAIQVAILVAALSIMPSITLADALCGNGVVEAGEDCDDGGTCIGGSNAGTHCTKELDCLGNGVCVGGTKAWTACADDSSCPGGRCQHCIPRGGDGCAANCTLETDVPFPLVPGQLEGMGLVSGTSGFSEFTDFLSVVPLPFVSSCNGGTNVGSECSDSAACPGANCMPPSQSLTIGKPRDGMIPIVVKAASVRLSGITVSTGACGCIRAVAAKTCGGTLFDMDGVTPTTDCTPGFTVGGVLCSAAAKPPCTFVHGDGNSTAGVIGCNGLDTANITWSQDSGGVSAVAGQPMLSFDGSGGPGSALFLSTTGITAVLGSCTGNDPSLYGTDGVYCTADDPIAGVIAVEQTAAAVTGVATAVVHNANGRDGQDLGPFSATGAPFDCSALVQGSTAGAGLVQAWGFVHLDTVGDVVVTAQLFASGTAPPTPTPTPTPPTSVCVGDCNGDADVTIDELILGVNIALGSADLSACPAFYCCRSLGSCIPSITCVIQAVGNALYGCPTPAPTPVLPHGHTCCECGDSACTDFTWVEVERLCSAGCQTFPNAECEAPCHPGPVGGPAVCVSLTPCTSDADCDDGNGCTIDTCTIEGCIHACVCD